MTQIELQEKYNPEGSNLRQAQLRMLEMLKFLDKICKQYNLTYWIDSGTLLGAARHQGFIPWDDDVDVCMPLEDAKQFQKIMLKNNPSKEFVLQCHKTDKCYFSTWFVLRDLKTEYLQNSYLHQIRRYRGLQVDIFTVENKSIKCFYQFAAFFQNRLINRVLFKTNSKIVRLLYINPAYYILQSLIPLFRVLSPKRDFIRMPYGVVWKTRELSDIYPVGRIEFEGGTFSCPHNVDNYLTSVYGNWRKIPSQDKIKTHNVQVVFK